MQQCPGAPRKPRPNKPRIQPSLSGTFAIYYSLSPKETYFFNWFRLQFNQYETDDQRRELLNGLEFTEAVRTVLYDYLKRQDNFDWPSILYLLAMAGQLAPAVVFQTFLDFKNNYCCFED